MSRAIWVQVHRSEGIVSRLIKWQTRGPYSHASVLLDDGTIWESVASDGVRRCHATTYAKQYAANQIDSAKVILTDEEYERFIQCWMEQEGKPYDRSGVLGFVTRRRQTTHSNARWFCAEILYYALSTVCGPLFNKTEPWEVHPTLLARAPQFTWL